jgi:hypothetical protein
MAKKKSTKSETRGKSKKITNEASLKFLEEYINNAAPTGFQKPGPQLW